MSFSKSKVDPWLYTFPSSQMFHVFDFPLNLITLDRCYFRNTWNMGHAYKLYIKWSYFLTTHCNYLTITIPKTFMFIFPEEKITTLLVFGQHIAFLMLIMFLTAYLQVPPMSRVLILIVTFVNSAIEIQSGKGAGFIRMAGVDFSIIMGKATMKLNNQYLHQLPNLNFQFFLRKRGWAICFLKT